MTGPIDRLLHGTPYHWDRKQPERAARLTFEATHDLLVPQFHGKARLAILHAGVPAWAVRSEGLVVGALWRNAQQERCEFYGAAGSDAHTVTVSFAVRIPTGTRSPRSGTQLREALAFETPAFAATGDRQAILPRLFSLAYLNHLVRESVRLFEPEARARNVALKLELAPTLPTVSCNDIQIEQVLLNLLLNGVEAVEVAENGHRTLSVRTALAGDTAEVAVSDSGIGLPQAPADVFAPFYTTKASGLGMGLSISRSIIEAHGGRLWGTPNPERGATFHFTLPV